MITLSMHMSTNTLTCTTESNLEESVAKVQVLESVAGVQAQVFRLHQFISSLHGVHVAEVYTKKKLFYS